MLDKNDVTKRYTKGSGAGGQHRNKVETAVVLTHNPTGVTVKCEEQRSQQQNEERAWEMLEKRLEAIDRRKNHQKKNTKRIKQIGTGLRGDKIRTYRVKDDLVIDHRSNKKIRLKDITRGKINKLH